MADDKMRRGLYAKLAIARKQLPDMDEEAYRDLLQSEFGTRHASELTTPRLARLVHKFAQMGVQYTAPAKSGNKSVGAQSRPDWIEITDTMPYAKEKRQILAIWRKLGYSMTSLETRVKRAFGVPVFLWLHKGDQVSILLSDLQRREKAFDAKKATQ